MLLSYVIQQRVTLDEAAVNLKLYVDHAALEAAVATLKARAQGFIKHAPIVKDPVSYHDKAWYLGPKEKGHWSHYLDRLGPNAFALDQLDRETTSITGLLANPLVKGSKRKGLVLGNVQSGKTRNFAGVIAKAVDAGYRFVIVLAGIHNNLRTQSQDRLDSQLFDAKGWYPLTTSDSDFEAPLKPAELFRNSQAIYAVVKKNSNRLGKLNDMLVNEVGPEVLQNWPVLIVDDEADQASPNSLAQKGEISTINSHLRDLWKTVRTGTYVAYTATPFANVLIDPELENDLFPSDFITSIEPGEGYFGAERVFGLADTIEEVGNGSDGLDMVRQISREEADSLKPPSDADARAEFEVDLPVSLKEAIDWFAVATAIRRARGQDGHSSMLVHTTHYSAPHFTMKQEIEYYVEELRGRVSRGDLAPLADAWHCEVDRVMEARTVPLPDWAEVAAQVPGVLDAIETIVDNGDSKDRLNYGDGRPRTVIAVGGGTLSRGLTLEGLVVSYFTRTSNAYDTLLQMGRWFGYRPGYEDLPRIWVTEGLDDDYAFLARVEKDLRSEILTVSQSEFTPRQLGVRVRCHPGRLLVTAQNKMYAAETVQMGLSGQIAQTFLLDGSLEAFHRNVTAVDDLVGVGSVVPLPGSGRRFIARGVEGESVRRFIETFVVHPDQAWLGADQRQAISQWIGKFADGPRWNVVLMSSQAELADQLDVVKLATAQLVCLNRAPMRDSSPERINMKAVLSKNDLRSDLAVPGVTVVVDEDNVTESTLRRRYANGEGLILIYPLSPSARGKSAARTDMPVDHPLLAFGVAYPHVNDDEGEHGTFISVRRSWQVPESVEGDEEQIQKDEEE